MYKFNILEFRIMQTIKFIIDKHFRVRPPKPLSGRNRCLLNNGESSEWTEQEVARLRDIVELHKGSKSKNPYHVCSF